MLREPFKHLSISTSKTNAIIPWLVRGVGALLILAFSVGVFSAWLGYKARKGLDLAVSLGQQSGIAVAPMDWQVDLLQSRGELRLAYPDAQHPVRIQLTMEHYPKFSRGLRGSFVRLSGQGQLDPNISKQAAVSFAQIPRLQIKASTDFGLNHSLSMRFTPLMSRENLPGLGIFLPEGMHLKFVGQDQKGERGLDLHVPILALANSTQLQSLSVQGLKIHVGYGHKEKGGTGNVLFSLKNLHSQPQQKGNPLLSINIPQATLQLRTLGLGPLVKKLQQLQTQAVREELPKLRSTFGINVDTPLGKTRFLGDFHLEDRPENLSLAALMQVATAQTRFSAPAQVLEQFAGWGAFDLRGMLAKGLLSGDSTQGYRASVAMNRGRITFHDTERQQSSK